MNVLNEFSNFILNKIVLGLGHKLVVFVKMLTEKVKLHPQINTYTINLLVFFYFQSKGYLPKLLDLIELPTPKCKSLNLEFAYKLDINSLYLYRLAE